MKNKSESMEKKVELSSIPKVRFPEFRNAVEWEEKKIEDVCYRISQGGTPDTGIPEYWNGAIEWLTPAEMGKNENRFIKSTVRKITNLGLKNCSSELLPINSVILSTRAPIGHLVINKSEMAINQGCKALIPNKSTNYDFLYYSLMKFKSELIDLGAGNTFKELSGNSLKSFKLFFPSLPEQQKIADCLSSLDELIFTNTQKLDKLKTYKKGLMQNLFPAEVETVPKLRFREFKNAGEWEEKKLGEVAEFINGRAHKQEELLTSGKYKVLRVGNFFTSDKWYFSDLELENNKYCENGDLLYAWSASFGPRLWIGDKVIYHYHIWKVLKRDNIDKNFLFIILDYETDKIKSASGKGIAMMHITKESIENWKILIPTLAEQKKIADCLSSLDEQISAQAQKIEALKVHKKGLMQGLFPNMDNKE